MAYIKQMPNGNFRVQIERDGVRESRCFEERRMATAWARERERALVGARRARKTTYTLRTVEPLPLHFIARTPAEIAATAAPVVVTCGVYFLLVKGSIVYVGQSKCVEARVAAHRKDGRRFDAMAVVPCEPRHLDIIEATYIHAFRPPWNTTAAGRLVLPTRRELVAA